MNSLQRYYNVLELGDHEVVLCHHNIERELLEEKREEMDYSSPHVLAITCHHCPIHVLPEIDATVTMEYVLGRFLGEQCSGSGS